MTGKLNIAGMAFKLTIFLSSIRRQCVTEKERYSAKGFVSKPDRNKGALKQEAWTESLQELTEKPGIDYNTKQLLIRIAAQTNVPRKKPKFINFLKNCLRIDQRRAEGLWSIIEKNLEEFNAKNCPPAPEPTPPSDSPSAVAAVAATNGNAEAATIGDTETNGNDIHVTKWKEIIVHALSQPDLDTSIRKLLKKLQKHTAIPENIAEIKKKKFIKFVQQTVEVEADVAKSIWQAFDASRSVVINADSTVAPKSPKKRKHSENVVADASESAVKDKKKKRSNGCANETIDANGNNAELSDTCDLNNSAFDWEKNISKVFKKHKQQNELDLAFLKSKVLKKYSKENEAANASLSHIEKKITKVIKKINKFVVEDEVVKLRDA